jgi:hypothetical protein
MISWLWSNNSRCFSIFQGGFSKKVKKMTEKSFFFPPGPSSAQKGGF